MLRYLIGHLLLITLTAPWIFLAVGQETMVAGLPLWVIYSVAASVVYAIFVAISYGRLWNRAGGQEGVE
ncbi:hypothetical protein [Cerasicoccus arenae]|uniref:DUF3311 domain-containing protein n=1 Tax=Cerasicoccus arenae TaxID=424488 RepID=A0A8J3GD01_9BACT|nr:hypothetical protein [Cerasicoccus arenae]MBK1860046.1 hypothetical protein [Cerasicoccus arenae]GHB93236.1 hypothetical protein GCM10007047_05680 [Cerasicoccus arenae]